MNGFSPEHLSIRSPVQQGFLVQRPLSRTLLKWATFCWKVVRSEKKSIPSPPQKILISNLAHLGDVVIATTVLPVLKKAYPDCVIGFLGGSEALIALQDHPLVNAIHVYSHAYMKREKGGCKAVLQQVRTFFRALSQVRKERYDVAIDLYPFFPNAIFFLWMARIPVRIGYTSGGLESLLTHPVVWQEHLYYMGRACLKLLTYLGLETHKESPLPYYPFSEVSCEKKPYLVVHMGLKSSLKSWSQEKWVELITQLQKRGHRIVLTGQGREEEDLCKEVSLQTGAQNLCAQLFWKEFLGVLWGASLVVTIDSVTVHLAAAKQIPTVVLFSGISSPRMWLPPSPESIGLIEPVPCAPCFKRQGCASMCCIQGLSVQKVFETAVFLLNRYEIPCAPHFA